MSFEIKIPNISPIADRLRKNVQDRLDQLMPEIKDEVIKRTLSGVDVNGAPFVRYSPQYAKYKSKRGLSATPDLRLTGQMLNSLQTETKTQITVLEGTIKVTGSFNQDKASWNQSGDSNPIRRFMGLSRDQIIKIKDRFKNIL